MNLRLHHIGHVVENIGEELDRYQTMGFTVDRKVYRDEAHGVSVGKITMPGNIYIELLTPLSDASPIASFAKSGGGYHHICFEADDMDAATQEFIAHGAFYLSHPLPSVWDDRHVCFLGTPHKDIIELITHASYESF